MGFRVGAALKVAYVKLGVSMELCQDILREIGGKWQAYVTSMVIIFPFLASPKLSHSLSQTPDILRHFN